MTTIKENVGPYTAKKNCARLAAEEPGKDDMEIFPELNKENALKISNHQTFLILFLLLTLTIGSYCFFQVLRFQNLIMVLTQKEFEYAKISEINYVKDLLSERNKTKTFYD